MRDQFDHDGEQAVVTIDESAEPGDWLPVLARILVDADQQQSCKSCTIPNRKENE